MRESKKLTLDQINRKLKPYKALEKITVPDRGWIYTIRKSLNMTLEQLGNRLDITRQGVKNLENREVKGAISLNNLKEVGRALDMNLIYGFSSKYDSVEELVNQKAKMLAKKIVLRTHQNMQLENQGNSREQIEKAIEELTQELIREMSRSIWD